MLETQDKGISWPCSSLAHVAVAGSRVELNPGPMASKVVVHEVQ